MPQVSAIDATSVNMRVSRDIATTLADADASNDRLVFAGTVTGAQQINLLGYQTYEDSDGHLDFTEVAADVANARYADAIRCSCRTEPRSVSGLGVAGDSRFHVRPGVAVTTAAGQDLTLDADWDLLAWRFGAEPGELTLRSGRDLVFNASLSDGFQGTADLTDPFAMPVLLAWRVLVVPAGRGNRLADCRSRVRLAFRSVLQSAAAAQGHPHRHGKHRYPGGG